VGTRVKVVIGYNLLLSVQNQMIHVGKKSKSSSFFSLILILEEGAENTGHSHQSSILLLSPLYPKRSP
jgi:hypothetical protein